jgi:hypothetical protein
MNGDRLITSNYRLISLLTSFSKVFEKLIYARLYKHVCKTTSWSMNDMGLETTLQQEKLNK